MRVSTILSLFLSQVAVEACLLDHERPGGNLRRHIRRATNDTTGGGSPARISHYDRFDGGKILPRGLGSQPEGTYIDTIMNPTEVDSALKALASVYSVEVIEAPEKTHENRPMYLGKVNNGLDCDEAFRVYLMAGIHARERGGPDGLVYFISDLLWAQSQNTGLKYGDNVYTNEDVITALSTGIVFMPWVNPDGITYDQSTGSCWRKNRNPAGAVDLNRNFDFLWDFPVKFAPNINPASNNPNDETYHGVAAFSEPETRNVKWVMDTYSKVRWFVDLHSYSGLVLFPWGDDTNQDDRPAENFRETSFDGQRGRIPDIPIFKYKEYIEAGDWDTHMISAGRVSNAMRLAANRQYNAKQSVELYPTCGTSDDYAFSRHLEHPDLNKIYSLTIEFGHPNPLSNCEFYPSPDQYNKGLLEIGAGFMEFLLQAARLGLGDPRECPDIPGGDCAPTCKPGDCGGRATCEYYDPIGGSTKKGNSYCFCQAGYKATGVDDNDVSKQYHVTWETSLGDQTHRVQVRPGQDCWDTCDNNRCTEVPLKDTCR